MIPEKVTAVVVLAFIAWTAICTVVALVRSKDDDGLAAATEEQAAEVYRHRRHSNDSPGRIGKVDGVTATGEAREIYNDEYR